jgi:glutamate dehydrogenase/leucine dehydrogenase
MTSLRGCYVTAEDVGTNVIDMADIFSRTRFTTCIPPELGGSGNPSVPTARGVVCGMEAALEFLGLGTIEGKTVAVQGMGNVGEPAIRFLFEKGAARVVAGDIDRVLVESTRAEFAGRDFEAVLLERGDESFLATACDILAPCATGAVLNPRTIPHIKAKIVCGAANNQLEDSDRDDALLHQKGITYVPDFLTNRMGIVNCSNEQYGFVNHDPAIERHLARDWEYSIHQTTLRVLGESRESGEPPARVALRQADRLSLEEHPIFGHRGVQIIRSLLENRWHES